MNLEELQAMSDKELNELSAVKVMGWEVRGTSTAYFIGQNTIIRTKETTSYGDAWNPTSDMNDVYELESKLLESCDYFDHFAAICKAIAPDHNGFMTYQTMYAFMRSTARERCIASILAKEE